MIKNFIEFNESKKEKIDLDKLSEKIFKAYKVRFKQIANMNVSHDGPLYIRSFATEWLKDNDTKINSVEKKSLNNILSKMLDKEK